MSKQATIKVEVQERVAETREIVRFRLGSIDGSPLPPFSAGAHIDVHLPGGLVRQYSLCNAGGGDGCYHIAVLRDPQSRGGSAALHDIVAVGDELEIGGPRNLFPLEKTNDTPLFIAGGIGITPILCMVERVAALGHPVELHYAARSRAEAAFADRIAASAYAPAATFYFGDSGAPRMDLAALLADPDPGRHVYICGPARLLSAAREAAAAAGWPDDRVRFEYFEADPAAMPEGTDSFEVQIASTGQILAVASDRTVAQVLEQAGIEIPLSCEQGVCGTCLTRVLEGEPDHRDFILTDEEKAAKDCFTPCCSRALSPRLVLDL